ncbi:MAG: hypothetical protein ACPGQL_11155 [Thermoplasmatota archaeon]
MATKTTWMLAAMALAATLAGCTGADDADRQALPDHCDLIDENRNHSRLVVFDCADSPRAGSTVQMIIDECSLEGGATFTAQVTSIQSGNATYDIKDAGGFKIFEGDLSMDHHSDGMHLPASPGFTVTFRFSDDYESVNFNANLSCPRA